MLCRCFLCSEYSDTECLVKIHGVYVHKDCRETMAYPLTYLEKKMENEMASFFRAHPEMRIKKGEKK